MKKFALLLTAALLGNLIHAEQHPSPSAFRHLIKMLAQSDAPATQINVLRGMNAALKGKRNLPPPEGWIALYDKLKASPDAEIRQQAQSLAIVFGGGGGALEELRKVLADSAAQLPARRAALDSLLSAKDAASLPVFLALIGESGPLRLPALRGLASFDDARVPRALLAAYPRFGSDEKRDALAALAARGAWARALTAAVDAKAVARADLSAPLARQLQDLKDMEINAWLAKNWGAVRETSADKQKQIAGLKTLLTIDSLNKADPSHGRAIFAQTCAACHTLFGPGGHIGPELPGAFEDIDYLLQNIVDPNAIIGKDYQQTTVRTKDGQMVMGVPSGEDATTLTLKTLAGPLTVQRADVAEVTVLETSLMPEGLLAALNEAQVRDLFAYLRRHGQVPMLLTPNNANDFFNGTDLSRWIPSRAETWRVEKGEIIGRGNGERAESLMSDMVAGDFRLTAQVQLTGADAKAEVLVRGQLTDGGLEGLTVGFGKAAAGLQEIRPGEKAPASKSGKAYPVGKWVPIEVVAAGGKVRVTSDDHAVIEWTGGAGNGRTVPAFYVSGEGAELRIKDVRLELLGK